MARHLPHPLEEAAARCRTPRQFTLLLRQLRTYIPYRQMVACCGNPATCAVYQLVEVDFPRRFLGWYLSHGMHRTDPLFRNGVLGGGARLRSELLRRLPPRSALELRKKVDEFQLQYEMAGGLILQGRYLYISLTMNGETEARAHLPLFARLLPCLCRALGSSHTEPYLTSQKRTILMWRAYGTPVKQIASDLGISPRTVKMHLEEIRRKLCAEDLVNAVWIAGQMGLIG